jgi:hypothetical protein
MKLNVDLIFHITSITSYDITSYDITSYDIISYDIILYHINHTSFLFVTLLTGMPQPWLEKSMDTMKLLQSRNITKKVKIPQQSICEKFTFISFEHDSQSTTNFDHITPHELDASTLDSSIPDPDERRLSELPTAFWPQTSPHVMRDAVDESREPNMKTRLETSPFGNPSLIFEQNERLRETSRLSQVKLRQGKSRLLQAPHPNKILRVSQCKKLYPSHPQYQQQQQRLQQQQRAAHSRNSSGGGSGYRRSQSTGPVEVPVDTVQHKVVAEKLFAAGSLSRPSSAAANGNGNTTLTSSKQSSPSKGNDVTSPTVGDTPSSMDHLTYAERLQVMILHCQDSFNKNDEDEEEEELS